MKILWSWLDLSETASNDLVYYAGIWVAYFLGARDPHHEISNHLIGLIEKGKKRVVVSYLLIMETVYAIRKRSVRYQKISDAATMIL